MATGLRMVWQRRGRIWRSGVQGLSGIYLALFLSIHLVAVMQARLRGIETDLAFAAAGMHAGYWKLFFCAVLRAGRVGVWAAYFGAHRQTPSPAFAYHRARTAAVLAVALVALLAGVVTPLDIAPALIQVFP